MWFYNSIRNVNNIKFMCLNTEYRLNLKKIIITFVHWVNNMFKYLGEILTSNTNEKASIAERARKMEQRPDYARRLTCPNLYPTVSNSDTTVR